MIRQRGFTLIELLLSVTIIAIIAGTSLPFYVSFQARNELDIAANSIVDMLRHAQNYSRNGDGDSQWGVRVQTGSAVLFKGANYSSRDVSYDETTSVPGSVSASGLIEVSYTKLAAVPSTTGTLTLTSNINETRTLTLNAKGMVNY